MQKPRKRPLAYCATYYFYAEDFNYASPLRAMAQFVKRNEEHVSAILGLNVNVGDDGWVGVSLTVEWDDERWAE